VISSLRGTRIRHVSHDETSAVLRRGVPLCGASRRDRGVRRSDNIMAAS
jgi:hypothetical protein